MTVRKAIRSKLFFNKPSTLDKKAKWLKGTRDFWLNKKKCNFLKWCVKFKKREYIICLKDFFQWKKAWEGTKQSDVTACQKLLQRLSLAELFRQDMFPQQPKDSAMCNNVVALIWTVLVKLEVNQEALKIIQTVIQSLKYKSRPYEKN